MGQRRHHYEQAFEAYLRDRRIPYVSVHEARKALLPEGARVRRTCDAGACALGSEPLERADSLKSFDFVVYGRRLNLLLDVKGRRLGGRTARGAQTPAPRRAGRRLRMENWVTREDVDSLRAWEALFGDAFEAGFVFVYWCDEQPPDALFQEVFEHAGRWYALRAVRLSAYRSAMKARSERWGTVDLPARVFESVSQPFTQGWTASPGDGWTPDARGFTGADASRIVRA